MLALPPLEIPKILLGFDLDGTLLNSAESPPLALDFFDHIREIRQDYHALWGLCTGRSLMHTIEGLNEGNFPFLPDYIIAREQEIHYPNEVGRWVPHSKWNKVCEKDHRRLFRKMKHSFKEMKHYIETQTQGEWIVQKNEPAGLVAKSEAEIQAFLNDFLPTLNLPPELSYQQNEVYLRFNHARYSKGTGLLKVASEFNIAESQICVAGDQLNDRSMMTKEVANGWICPANSNPEIKKIVSQLGGYVAKKNASLGVIEGLKKYFPPSPSS